MLGDVGTGVVFEDEHVRVWQLRLAPGEDSAIHRRLSTICSSELSGRSLMIPRPGGEGPYRDYLEADVVTGSVVHVARGGVETARNVGRRHYLEVIVELKD